MLMKGGRNKTVLCLDIGNTSTGYGVFRGKKLISYGHFPTPNIPVVCMELIRNTGNIPNLHILVSSVVPKYTSILSKILSRHPRFQAFRERVYVVGGRLKVPIRHNYRSIKKLGSDRLVNAYGALKKYGAPLLIFDFGTAVTCDYVSRKGVFEGGLIVPGPEISLKVLSEKAALLPAIPFPRKFRPLLGRDTVGCMKAGVLQGYGALTDELIERFRRRYGRKLRVVATGGLSGVIAPFAKKIDFIDPLLTLRSLAYLFEQVVVHHPPS